MKNLSKIVFIVIFIGICFIPSLYCCINTEACSNVYNNTGDIPFYVCIEDQGVIGTGLKENLQDNDKFNWIFVNKHELKDKVSGDEYAGLIIPANLTSNVKQQKVTQIELIVNNKNSPVASRMASTGAKTINEELSNTIMEKLSITVESAVKLKLREAISKLDSGLVQMKNGKSQLVNGRSKVYAGKTELSNGIRDLNAGGAKLENGAGKLSYNLNNINDKSHVLIGEARRIAHEYNITLPELDKAFDKILAGTGELADGSTQIKNGVGDLTNGATRIGEGSIKLSDGSIQLADGSVKLADGSIVAIETMDNELKKVNKDLEVNEKFMNSPTQLKQTNLYDIPKYGDEVFPFYAVLSTFVGALISLTIFSTKKAGKSPIIEYFGKYPFFIGIALIQTTITLIWASFFIDLNILTCLSLYLVSLMFMTLAYALVSCLGLVGEGLLLLLLVLSISTTGGMYPLELVTPLFRWVYHVSPMTYGINIVREALLGADWFTYHYSLVICIGVTVGSFIVGIAFKKVFSRLYKLISEIIEDIEYLN